MNNRTFKIDNRRSLADCLHWIDTHADTVLAVDVRPWKANRTTAQNSLLWRWHTERAAHHGLTKEEAHGDFKYRHVCPVLIRDDQDYSAMIHAVKAVRDAGMADDYERLRAGIVRETSSTRLNTAQMAEALTEYEHQMIAEGVDFTRPDGDYGLALSGEKND